MDKGVIELLGPYGIAATMRTLSKRVSTLQSGLIYHYAFIMLIGLTVLITFIGLWDILSFWVDSRLYLLFLCCFLFLPQRNEMIRTA